MKKIHRGALALSNDENAILNQMTKTFGTRSEALRHALIQAAIFPCGWPIAQKLLALPPPLRVKAVADLRMKLEELDLGGAADGQEAP